MSRKKLTLISVNDKINRLQRQVTKLEELIFEWGQKDREDIDKINLKISKEIKDEK